MLLRLLSPSGARTADRRRSPVGWCTASVLGAVLVTGCSGGSATPVADPTLSPSRTPVAVPTVVPSRPTTPSPKSSPSPHNESAPPLGQPVCLGAALSVVDADAVTVGGNTEEVFVIRTSGPDCQLTGYPGLVFAGADRKPLTVAVNHGGHGLPAGAPGPVTLSRGTSISFGVATARTGTCQQAASVQVTLPAVTPAMTVSTALKICAGSVGITPVQRRIDADGG